MRGLGVDDYSELVRRSSEEPEWFWPAAIEDMGLEFSQPWERVFDDSRGPEWTTWFVGGQVNIAANCVHRGARGRPSGSRPCWRGEDGERRELTYAELSRRGDPLRGGAARARRRAGRPRRAVPADVARGRRSPPTPARTSARSRCRSSPASALPRSRSACGTPRRRSSSPPTERCAAAAVPMKEIARRGRRGRALGRAWSSGAARGRADARADVVGPTAAGELPPARGRLRAPVPARLHVGHDRQAEGRRPRARRLPRQDRAGGRLPGRRPAPATSSCCATDMGWIMGPWTVVGAGALGATLVFAEGAPDWPGPTGCGPRSSASA